MKRIVTAVCLLLASASTCWANSFVNNVTVVGIKVDSNGKAVITFSAPITGLAGCAVAFYNSSYAVDTTTNGGKSVMSIANAAMLAGQTIQHAGGANACTLYPNTAEDLLTICVGGGQC